MPQATWEIRVTTPTAQEADRRLRSIEGQVRGLRRMVEEDRYCIDILTQLSAIQEALAQVGKLILRNYLENCFTQALRTQEDPTPVYDELMDVIFKFRK